MAKANKPLVKLLDFVVRLASWVVGQFDCGGVPGWKGGIRAHILWMDQILPPALSDVEFDALRQIAAHPATWPIPPRVQSRLTDIGYAKEVLGGIVLTEDALQRIATDQ